MEIAIGGHTQGRQDPQIPIHRMGERRGAPDDKIIESTCPFAGLVEADEAVLVQRFKETRRKHPLTGPDTPLLDQDGKTVRIADFLGTEGSQQELVASLVAAGASEAAPTPQAQSIVAEPEPSREVIDDLLTPSVPMAVDEDGERQPAPAAQVGRQT